MRPRFDSLCVPKGRNQTPNLCVQRGRCPGLEELPVPGSPGPRSSLEILSCVRSIAATVHRGILLHCSGASSESSCANRPQGPAAAGGPNRSTRANDAKSSPCWPTAAADARDAFPLRPTMFLHHEPRPRTNHPMTITRRNPFPAHHFRQQHPPRHNRARDKGGAILPGAKTSRAFAKRKHRSKFYSAI